MVVIYSLSDQIYRSGIKFDTSLYNTKLEFEIGFKFDLNL